MAGAGAKGSEILAAHVVEVIEQERVKLGKLIHYPHCWDVGAYQTLEDALSNIGCNQCDCTEEIRALKE